MQVGDSLEEFLVSATDDAKLRQLMMSMSEAIRTIAFKVPCSTRKAPSRAERAVTWHGSPCDNVLYDEHKSMR